MVKLLIITFLMVTVILVTLVVPAQNKSGDIFNLLFSNMSEIKILSWDN